MERLDKAELSRSRLDRALKFLKAAINNAEIGDYLTTANRSYYAVYSAIRALLILEHNEMTKHVGNISEFRRLYIKSGVFKPEYSKYIDSLFETRHCSDYDSMFIVSKDEVLVQLEHAKEIVNKIAEYLASRYNSK